ncbi:ABC transporter permease [Halobaculum sp. MBLA0147]|uniref:ABC transporter permease n=1 Tax=Halobaculum sp. MBLA0147 TaxID=3079934 RepID=UPI0035265DEF
MTDGEADADADGVAAEPAEEPAEGERGGAAERTRPDGGTTREAGPLGTVDPSPERRDGGVLAWLRQTGLLFYTVFRRDLTILVRYPVDFVGALVSLFLLFLLLVEGGRRVGGQAFSDSLGGVVVGYLVFMLAQSAYQGLANAVGDEAQWGTLERLHLSPLGFGRIMILTAVSKVLTSFVYVALLLPLTLLVTGESLTVDLLTVVPLASLGLASVIGMGFVFGGASVLYKRIGSLFRILQFGLIGLIAAPVEQLPWLRAFPIVQANYMLGQAMREGVRLWEFSPRAHAILVAVGVAYFLAGYGVFRLLVARARKLGALGDY